MSTNYYEYRNWGLRNGKPFPSVSPSVRPLHFHTRHETLALAHASPPQTIPNVYVVVVVVAVFFKSLLLVLMLISDVAVVAVVLTLSL